ncbi:MAG: hypothetical protein JW776_02515 [Candidatus Lokiarchaeota archaeon]|nr:hypothetical protein [Candidatus Lokiarchaeota archaeon]
MQEMKSTDSYQVFFTSNPSSTEKDLFLTFFFQGNPIAIRNDKDLLPLLKKSTQIAENSFTIPSIVDVISNTAKNLEGVFSSYVVVMWTERGRKRKEGKERGFLIGKSKEAGYYLFGIWPYSYFLEMEANIEIAVDGIKDLINNGKSYSEILLLTEK